MSEGKINCPSCGENIELNSALSSKLKSQLKAEFSSVYNKKLKEEKEKMWELAQKRAKEGLNEKLTTEMADLKNQIKEKEEYIKKSREKELEFLKKERELKAKEKEMEVELEKKLLEGTKKLEEDLKKKADEEFSRKMMEKEKQLNQMRKTIEDLKRKSEQGSMQVQGDAQEDDLKNLITSNFPFDLVEDVPTGIKGADLIQKVRNKFAQNRGVILWESKNTKTWSESWISKLKQDQGLAKADVCVLVSRALPEDVDGFALRDGVWVCSYEFVLPLVQVLRFHLREVGTLKNSFEGKDEKMESLYSYLSGSQFKNRIENIVMAFTNMKNDLETEKRSLTRIWNKREKEIERVIFNTSGMYGDLEGIIGSSLPNVESLSLPSGDDELLEE